MTTKDNFPKTTDIFNLLFWIWVMTITLFGVFVLWATTHSVTPLPGEGLQPMAWVVLTDIGVGALAFLAMVYLKANEPARVFISLSLLILVFVAIVAVKAESKPIVFPTSSLPTSSESAILRNKQEVGSKNVQQVIVKGKSQVDCIGPDQKTFKTSKEECDRFKSAWGVKPSSHPTNGEALPKSTSQQSNYTCYVYPNGNVLRSKDAAECSKLLMDKTNLESLGNKCKTESAIAYTSCSKSCREASDEGIEACNWAYSGPNPGIVGDENKRQDCVNEDYGIFSKCLSTCVAGSQGKIESCLGEN